ncbi:hypothetical protein DL770_008428 [Monosporascus sp. CRB-9-2]|nr:hypothetical protein DL770_008428 [Monosporascus sp. CRB-9-2]
MTAPPPFTGNIQLPTSLNQKDLPAHSGEPEGAEWIWGKDDNVNPKIRWTTPKCWRPPENPPPTNGDPSSGAVALETKEAFNWAYQAELDPSGGDGKYSELDGSSTSRNVWPEEQDLPGFFAGFKPYYGEMLQLSRHLVRLFALSLALPETHFDSAVTHPGGVSRLLYYPLTEASTKHQPDDESTVEPLKTTGIRPHCDFECFTILLQTQSSGLQVLSPDGSWVDAEPLGNTFVVNIGELMTRMTNGLYKSTMHRVLNPTKTERYSIPFFFSVNYDSIVEPLPTCVTPANPPRYSRVTAGEYTIERLRLAVGNGIIILIMEFFDRVGQGLY